MTKTKNEALERYKSLATETNSDNSKITQFEWWVVTLYALSDQAVRLLLE